MQKFLQPKFVGSYNKVLKYNASLQLQAVNAEITGIKPQVLVTTTNKSVTASCSGISLTARAVNNIATFNLPFTGNWTFSDFQSSYQLTVDIIKQYSIILSTTSQGIRR